MSRYIRIAIVLAFILIQIPVALLADNSRDFTVSSFIPEHFSDLEWTVGGNIALNGSDSERDREVAPGFRISQTNNESSDNYQNMRFDTRAVYYYETVKRQFQFEVRLTAGFNHRGNEQVNNSTLAENEIQSYRYTEESYLAYTLSNDIRGTIRQYFGEQFFGEFTAVSDYGDDHTAYNDHYSFSKDERVIGDMTSVYTSVSDRESSNGQREHRGRFDIAFGVGHIYEGSYAATALYIIDQLREEGAIRREPTKEQMLKLTELIYRYRNTHEVDKRYHRQEALNEIIALLEDERVVRDVNSQALYAVQDVWDYYPTRTSAPRLFGIRLKAGLGYLTENHTFDYEDDRVELRRIVEYDTNDPGTVDTLQNDTSISISHSRVNYSDEIPYFTAGVEYHLPISHLWQFDGQAGVDLNLENVSDGSDPRRLRDSRDLLYADLYLSRFLDSRTTIKASLNADFLFKEINAVAHPIDPTYPDERKVWLTDFRLRTGLSVLYRLAVPTTLSVNASFTSQFISEPEYAFNYDIDTYRYQLSGSITHYIF